MQRAIFYLRAALWDPPIADESGRDFHDYYDKDWEYEEKFSTKYYGRNVIWIGEEGRMLRASPDYISPRDDNIFEWDKLQAVRDHIIQSSEKVELDAALADVIVIDRTLIEETQEGAQSGRVQEWTIDHPFSTGDDELDEYLADPEAFLAREEDPEERREELEKDIQISEALERGDFRKLWVRIRDGNHRVFGAIAAGEPYIWVKITKDSKVPGDVLE